MGVEGLNKKGKGFMDMDNSVLLRGEEGIKGLNGNVKNTIKGESLLIHNFIKSIRFIQILSIK